MGYRKRFALPPQSIDLNVLGAQIEFVLPAGAVAASVQAFCPEQTWGTAVLTVYRSHGGPGVHGCIAVQPLEAGQTLGPDDDMTVEFSTQAFGVVAVRVTTAEGGANTAIVTVNGMEEVPG